MDLRPGGLDSRLSLLSKRTNSPGNVIAKLADYSYILYILIFSFLCIVNGIVVGQLISWCLLYYVPCFSLFFNFSIWTSEKSFHCRYCCIFVSVLLNMVVLNAKLHYRSLLLWALQYLIVPGKFAWKQLIFHSSFVSLGVEHIPFWVSMACFIMEK